MSEKKSTQSQHVDEIFAPFRAATKDQIERMGALFGEWQKLEAQGADRARSAVDEVARLTKSSFDYAARLGEEWRKLALETSRQALDWTPLRAR